MGWLPLDTLSFEKQIVSIAPLAGPTGTRAYYIANRNDATGNEYYILENRQRSPWYSEVFGYGMLVTHIDYDRAKWIDNKVNTTLSHPRISIIPADNVLTPSSKAEDASSYQTCGRTRREWGRIDRAGNDARTRNRAARLATSV